MNDLSIKIGDRTYPVAPDKADLARQIAKNSPDGVIDESALESYVKSDHTSETACSPTTVRGPHPGNIEALAKEVGYGLADVANPNESGYHNWDSLIKDYDKLAAANPNLVKKEVIGKSAEGRDILAYKITEGAQGDTSNKTGVVITAGTHAREWSTEEAALQFAKDMVASDSDPTKKARLQNGEIWVVPSVNPDGYIYSQTDDNMWRKNRRPLEVDQLGKPTSEVGTDINRNFDDGNPAHATLYRPDGDKPGITSDDFDATSDDPGSEVYRGPSGASEPETKTLQNLILNHKNIKGDIDFHSYGNDIFYPWDHTKEESPHAATYKEIGGKIADATGWSCAQGSALYLNSGDSDETWEANNVLSFCFEMGDSFQPDPSELPKISSEASKGSQVFVDEVLARDKKGELPRA